MGGWLEHVSKYFTALGVLCFAHTLPPRLEVIFAPILFVDLHTTVPWDIKTEGSEFSTFCICRVRRLSLYS